MTIKPVSSVEEAIVQIITSLADVEGKISIDRQATIVLYANEISRIKPKGTNSVLFDVLIVPDGQDLDSKNLIHYHFEANVNIRVKSVKCPASH